MATDEKTKVNLSLSLTIDNELSWQELFSFVEVARRSGVDPESTVLVTGVSANDEVELYLPVHEDDVTLPAGSYNPE